MGDLCDAVRDNPGKSLALEIERQGSPFVFDINPESKPPNGKAIGFVGIEPKVIPLPDEIKLYASMGCSTPSSKPLENVAADEVHGQYAGKIDHL
ncbi:hypothetical protein ACLK1T_06590 [Escherichia coli]